MGKALDRALEAYPPKFVTPKRGAKRVQSENVDTHAPMRTLYVKAYRQAEKDTLEKAVEWIKKKYWLYGDLTGHDLEDLLDAFQEAMKE